MARQISEPALGAASPSLRLDGRVAWVTGADRGLGRAISRGLAAAGATVALTSRTEEEIVAACDELSEQGGTAIPVLADVSSAEGVDRAVEKIVAACGGVQILVNNAGINPVFTEIEKVTDDDWLRTLQVNLSGAFFCARAAVRVMKDAEGGSIINVSSVHGGVGHARTVPYAASKGGLELLTRSLALECAPYGIRVNSLAPGYFETDLTRGLFRSDRWRTHFLDRIPLGRFGRPEELIGAVLYLASDASSYTTGTTLHVDGGWTAQ